MEAKVIELTLPFPPSMNRYWRYWNSRVLISRTGRAFRQRVIALLMARRVQPLTGRLRIQIAMHPPDRRKHDIDNFLKALLDALEHGGAYQDDAQIVRLEVERFEALPGGRCLVRIENY